MEVPWKLIHTNASLAMSLRGQHEIKNINCLVTSPPYWGIRQQKGLGLEPRLEDYVDNLVKIFEDIKPKLTEDATVWVNINDSFFNKQNNNRNGATKSLGGDKVRGGGEYSTQKRESDVLKEKDLSGVPWRFAFGMQENGWYLRDAIIWHKPSPMPGGAKDRFVWAYETVFLFTKSKKYYFNHKDVEEDAVSKKGKRWRRNIWTIPSARRIGSHYAVMPVKLAELCILAGCPKGGVVLDPFCGTGTTGVAACLNDRKFIGIECDKYYVDIAYNRLKSMENNNV